MKSEDWTTGFPLDADWPQTLHEDPPGYHEAIWTFGHDPKSDNPLGFARTGSDVAAAIKNGIRSELKAELGSDHLGRMKLISD
jgi:hypothetical protein